MNSKKILLNVLSDNISSVKEGISSRLLSISEKKIRELYLNKTKSLFVEASKADVEKFLKKNKKKFSNPIEAATQAANKFGLEKELDNQKHWLWNSVSKMFKEETKIIDTLIGLFESKAATNITLNDGNTVSIDPKHANMLVEVHDKLNDENQSFFRNMIFQDTEGFMKVFKFCKEYKGEINDDK